MVQFETWLLRGLLGLLWVLPVWSNNNPIPKEQCTALHAVKERLNITIRRRYLKQNFPINYTIQVPFEEVFRLHNISRLLNEDKEVEMEHLRDLWLNVAKENIKKIVRVLPERHPTRKYLSELDNLFRTYEQSYGIKHLDHPDITDRIMEFIGGSNVVGLRSVKPKSLIDNCYRTMHCLFKDCFQVVGEEYDYCNIHWRKGKTTTP